MTRARDLAAFVSNADGDIKFDTDTLFIDSSANKVGIRTNTPPHPLSVFGTGAGNATVQIEGESGADPTINFLANNAQHWAIGVDDSDSDTFKISEHSALGTNDYFNIDVSGNVGIGNSNPDQRLTIGDNTTATEIIQFKNTGHALIYFGDAADADVGYLNYNHGANYFRIGVNAAERMRIDSSGNVLIGKTSTSSNVAGSRFGASGNLELTRSGGQPLYINRQTSDGTIVTFAKDGTTVGSIKSNSAGGIDITAGSDVRIINSNGAGFRTGSVSNNLALIAIKNSSDSDNTGDIGASSLRFDDIFATNGTIQTSDENEKQQIASLTDAEMTAAKAISKLFKTFKWNDSVAENSDNARTHAGVIAQQVEQAMTDAGLTASNYAFWCSDTWWETQTEVAAVEAVEAQDAVYDDDGNLVSEAVEAVEAQEAYTRTDQYYTQEEAPEGATERNRKGIRYPELLSFIGAATEQRLTSIEARLDALEA